MTHPVDISAQPLDLAALATTEGRIAILIDADGPLDAAARRIDRATRGAVSRARGSDAFARLKPGQVMTLAWPAGLAAVALDIVRLPRRASQAEAEKAGAALAKAKGTAALALAVPGHPRLMAVLRGVVLRCYDFTAHKTDRDATAGAGPGRVTVLTTAPDALDAPLADLRALAAAVFLTRDLVAEPANVLTTTEFARRLTDLTALGVSVTVLEEDALDQLGLRSLLAVGQGSASPSKLVVMEWNGAEGKAAEAAPLALVGKGVVFDSGGISIKPAAGMEEMTMDMGGAGVVAGVMHLLASRKAAAHVVGLVGLVENMPSGTAMRPGDVVRSLKGDTIEIVNTDAEGRLVLADVLWYAQTRFAPRAVINLATLTGAIIVALGHDNAGVFSNDDALARAVLKAAEAEGEGAWRMPLGDSYGDLIKSRIADIKNSGGRYAGAVTAAMFLQRFIKPGMPWVHLDIAGVAMPPGETTLAPKGPTGWGVRTLDRLVRDMFEA